MLLMPRVSLAHYMLPTFNYSKRAPRSTHPACLCIGYTFSFLQSKQPMKKYITNFFLRSSLLPSESSPQLSKQQQNQQSPTQFSHLFGIPSKRKVSYLFFSTKKSEKYLPKESSGSEERGRKEKSSIDLCELPWLLAA